MIINDIDIDIDYNIDIDIGYNKDIDIYIYKLYYMFVEDIGCTIDIYIDIDYNIDIDRGYNIDIDMDYLSLQGEDRGVDMGVDRSSLDVPYGF